MLDEIVARSLQIHEGEDGWVSLRGHTSKNQSQKAYFADRLIELMREGRLSWSVSLSKEIAFSISGDWTLIVVKHSNVNAASRYIGGTVDAYSLVVFKSGKALLSFHETCDNADYQTDS